MGSNAIRLVFPDQSVDLDGGGAVQGWELDKLEDMLSLLDARGMGAVVTVFNRHDYANADRARDARKVASFLARFRGDARVLLWDVVSEPQPMGDPARRGRVLDWLGAMRDAFDANGHSQPVTIGAIGHYDVVIAEGHRSIIDLSDVVSVHCYGRSHPTATPGWLDGVNYQDGYCKASMQYIRNHTTKPILLEEFGWPDRESRAWPPSHP
jgi:Cellulase (glycosyl hydrolase family 5)